MIPPSSTRVRVVILGGPGDGTVVAQAVLDAEAAGEQVSLHGFLNDGLPAGSTFWNRPVLGPLEAWRSLPEDVRFIAALHKVKQMQSRARRILSLGIPQARWITLVHPRACVGADVHLGVGTFLAANVVVQPGAKIGDHASIRAGANLGHDSEAANFAYIGPNATLCGRARLGEGAHLGPNAAVSDGVTVGPYAVVGICSAVTKNVDGRAVYFGVPAKRIMSIPTVE